MNLSWMEMVPRTILKGFWLTLLFVLASRAWGAEITSSEVMEVSRSGRSLILSRGEAEGLRAGTVAKFFLQQGPASAPKLIPVAFGRAVKVDEVKSYWYLHQIQYAAAIKAGGHLVFIEKNLDILPGREELNIEKKQVISANQVSPLRYQEDTERGIPKELVFKEEGASVIEEIHDTKLSEGAQISATQFDEWATSKGLDYVESYMAEVQKKNISDPILRINEDKIKREHNEALTKSQADGVAKKINSLPNGLNDLYWKQEREAGFEVQKRVVINNIYQDSIEKRNAKRREPVTKSALAKMGREGRRWSSDMSDAELREYVVRTGISEEVIRQRAAINELNSHELTLHLATSLLDHTNPDDQNHRGRTYSFGIGYEFHFSRLFKSWLKLSAEVGAEWSRALYQVGPIHNATFQEGSYKFFINYYLYNKPTTVKDFSLYVGAGIKVGEADASSFEFDQKFQYAYSAFPIIQVGTKYRFISGDEVDNAVGIGFGINAKLSIEPLSYSLENQPTADVDGAFSLTDTKLYVGMSMYF